jgi:hypothetical protein
MKNSFHVVITPKHAALVLSGAAVVFAAAMFGGSITHSATTPKLSGSYSVTQTKVCPSSLSISQNQQNQAISVNYSWQDVSQHIGTATFTPSKSSPTQGSVNYTGWKVQGSVLAVNSGGDSFATSTDSSSATSYTVTSNSLTLSGVTYNAIQGAVAGGIIQQFTFLGLENGCSVNGIGVIQ